MNYEEYKNKYYDTILPMFIRGKRLNAFCFLREEFPQESTLDILDFLKRLFVEMTEYVKRNDTLVRKYLPKQCCVNCIGMCGKWKDFTKTLFDKDGNIQGSCCCQFKGVEELLKEDFTILRREKACGNYGIMPIYQVENGIVFVERRRRNLKNGTKLKTKEKLYFVNKERFVQKFVEIVRIL